MTAVGLDGWGWLHTPSDATERVVLGALLVRVAELRDQGYQQLAAHIVNTLGKAIK